MLVALGFIAYDRVPYVFLPKFEVAGMGGVWQPGKPLEHHFIVSRDFSEEDAWKVGNFYWRRQGRRPLDIGFYCLEGYQRQSFSGENMLYEYLVINENSPATLSTPSNPSEPHQGKACK